MSTKPTKIAYTAEATAHGGRDGRVASSDGHLDLSVVSPKELGGSGGGTNPEQLFAAGYSACFQSALGLVARRAKTDITGSTVHAKVGIGPNESQGFGLAVELLVTIPAVDEATARALVDQAHQVCPYSNATRGNVDVTLTVAA